MAIEWREAPTWIIKLAEHLIRQFHPELEEARIAFIMRSEASKSNGLTTIGKAKKVSAELQIHIDYDFIVWLASDEFARLSAHQREALIDHQLCHLQWIDDVAKITGHDFDGEFIEIIERYGLWWPRSDALAVAVQAALPLPKAESEPPRVGGVGTIDFAKVAKEAEAALGGE